MRRALLSLALVGLVAPLFLFPPVADAIIPPVEGAWKRVLDPLGVTPADQNPDTEVAPDGDVGILYEDTQPKFARSAPGSDTFTITTIDGALTGAREPELLAPAADKWIAIFENSAGTTWYAYVSTDDGATWTQKQAVVQNVKNIDAVAHGSRVSVAIVIDTSEELRYYRTSDDFTSFDRTDVKLSSGTEKIAGFGLAAYSANHVELWLATPSLLGVGTLCDRLDRRLSEDGGAFWGSAVNTGIITTDQMQCFSTALSVDTYNGRTVAMFRWSGTGAASNRILTTTSWGGAISVETITPASYACCDGMNHEMVSTDGVNDYFIVRGEGGVSFTHLWKRTAGGTAAKDGTSLLPTGARSWSMAQNGDQLFIGLINADVSSRFEVHTNKASTAIAPTTSAAVTNLVGFDVDATGTTAIARLASGGDVKAYAAGSLSPSATTATTFCTRVDGVAALADHVSYLQCTNGSPGDVSQVRIRSSNLGPPSKGTVCDGVLGDFCNIDINDEDIAGGQDGQLDLKAVQAIPFDFNTVKDTTFQNAVAAAWAFSTDDGRIGVMTYTWVEADIDATAVVTKTIDPAGGVPNQICTTRDNDEKTYLYGASSGANVRGYQVTFTGIKAFGGEITPAMNQVFAGPPSTSLANSIACGEGKFAIGATTGITVWNCRSCSGQSPLITKTDLGVTQSSGLAMSDDGRWLTAVVGTKAHVMCIAVGGCLNTLTNTTAQPGDVVATLAVPSGTFHEVRMQGSGTNVWIATSTTIARYQIYELTVGEDLSYDPDAVIIEPGASTGGGIFADTKSRNAPFLGGETAAGLFMGFLMVVILFVGGIGLVTGSGGGIKAGLYVGTALGVLGLIMAAGFDLIDWSIVFIVLVLVIGLALMPAAFRSGGGA